MFVFVFVFVFVILGCVSIPGVVSLRILANICLCLFFGVVFLFVFVFVSVFVFVFVILGSVSIPPGGLRLRILANATADED